MSATAEKTLIDRISWLGTAGFLVRDRLTVYIDPVNLDPSWDLPKADVVLITHSHEAHCSQKDVERLATASTIVAGPKDCVSRFRLNQLPMFPGETKRILGLQVRAVSSYNPKEDTVHPQRHNWLGFVADFTGGKLFHTGDATWVPEMAGVSADVLLYPAEGRDAFGAEDERKCLESLKPKVVVPMHFDPPGDEARLSRLRKECARLGLSYRLLSPGA